MLDHGKIIATGTADDLKKQTSTGSLEEAFLSLTGKNIREEAGSGKDQMKAMHKMWSGNKNK